MLSRQNMIIENYVDFRLRHYSFIFDGFSDIIRPQSVPEWTILLTQHFLATMIIVTFGAFIFQVSMCNGLYLVIMPYRDQVGIPAEVVEQAPLLARQLFFVEPQRKQIKNECIVDFTLPQNSNYSSFT